MKRLSRLRWIACLLLTTLLLNACNDGAQPDDESEHAAKEAAATNPDLIDIPASVRSNLGISFVQVEPRQVEKTLRVPGRFEYLPTARREYRTPVPGRVELLVEQFARVEAGTLLYRIDSPGWRELQQQLTEAGSQIELLKARIETFVLLMQAHEKHEESLNETNRIWSARVEQLETLNTAGGGRLEELTKAQVMLSAAQAELATVMEKDAELHADRLQAKADMNAAESRLHYLLDAAAAITAIDRDALIAQVEDQGRNEPRWATIDRIEVRTDVAGVVSEMGLTNGAWADEKTPVLTVVQPDRLRFRASGLQSDLGALRDGLYARIVPPTPTATGRSIPLTQTMTGALSVGLEGDPNDRTIDLYVVPEVLRDWARPGVSAQLEIVTDPSSRAELAIPLAAVQRDGLTAVIFRRNPGNPNQVTRMEADLGRDDGRWVELLSGVAQGDEIVLDGAFQLMLSTSGSIQKGGHFHADGTFHEEEN